MHDALSQFYIERSGVLQTWGEARPQLSLGNGGAQEYVKRPLTIVSAHKLFRLARRPGFLCSGSRGTQPLPPPWDGCLFRVTEGRRSIPTGR